LIIHLDAHGDVLRGLQVVETACGIPTALLGDKIEGELLFSSGFAKNINTII
jgi:hypothetical protein